MKIKNMTKEQLEKRLNRLIKRGLESSRWVAYIKYHLKRLDAYWTPGVSDQILGRIYRSKGISIKHYVPKN